MVACVCTQISRENIRFWVSYGLKWSENGQSNQNRPKSIQNLFRIDSKRSHSSFGMRTGRAQALVTTPIDNLLSDQTISIGAMSIEVEFLM